MAERPAPAETTPSGARPAYHVLTFGCRVNQADTQSLMQDLEARGYVRAPSMHDAKVVVLNTCTVTHRSDTDVRKSAHRVRRENPEARIVVTGCYAQRAPEAAADIRAVDAVVGQRFRSRLPVIADALVAGPATDRAEIHHAPFPETPEPVAPTSAHYDRTRPFVKIQDGCDAPCTYCIIPTVRGPARSATPDSITASVARLVAEGHQEVVLAGIHLGTYRGPGDETLADLVARILDDTAVRRLRLSCIEPMQFPRALIDLARRNPRLMPHFHLPLQSGSDAVLKRMVRPYRVDAYRALLEEIRAAVPRACIGTDLIVGFPGETEADFAQSLDAIADAPIDTVHVFSYSDRSGTPASRLGPKVAPKAITERSRAARALGAKKWARFLARQAGTETEAIILEPRHGALSALADNYAPLSLPLDAGRPGEVCRVRIGRDETGALRAVPTQGALSPIA